MKKSIISMMVIALMTACTNQETIESVPVFTEQSTVKNEIRSYEDALKIAQASITMLDGSKSSTRGKLNSRKIDLDNSRNVIKYKNKTRSNLGINDTLIYVFNFENEEGFVLVSASEKTEAVLAITEQGSYNPEVKSEIAGFELFIDLAKEYVAYTSKDENCKTCTRGLQVDTFVHNYTITVEPYVTVKWGQSTPEGEFCPNYIAGCSNTAMAQIMSYYQYPSGIPLTYSGADISYQNLNWSNMKSHNGINPVHDRYSSSCNNQEAHKAISRLLRQLGELNYSEYGSNSTSTSIFDLRQTFSNLGYNVSNINLYNGSNIRQELNNAHLIYMRGTRINEYNDSIGHGWVVDGYLTDIVTEYIMEAVGSNPTLWVIIDQFGSETCYYNHFNWGWNGINNGYFLDNVFNTALVIFPESVTTYNRDYCDEVYYFSTYH